MAGDWIKVENVTPDKPEIFLLAAMLDIDPDAALGKLIRLWVWADQQTYDGNAASVTLALLDRVSGVSGFAHALKKVGWLTELDTHFSFPNFTRHNGQSAKCRALSKLRTEKYRRGGNCPSVTKTSPEKRREEKRKRKNTKKDTGVYPDDFETFWTSYPRKESKGVALKGWAAALAATAQSKLAGADESPADFLARRAADYAASVANTERQFIQLPATWLNAHGWENEIGSRVPTAEDLANWSPSG